MIRLACTSLLFSCLLVGIVGCIQPASPTTFSPDETLKTFAGDWELVAFETAGKKLSQKAIGEISVSFEKDRCQLAGVYPGSGGFAVEEYLIQVHPTNSEKEVDFTYAKGPRQGIARQAIYSLQGTELKICMGNAGEPRPTEFASKEKPPTLLMVLKRRQ